MNFRTTAILLSTFMLGGCALWPERSIQPDSPKDDAARAARYTNAGESRTYANEVLTNFKKVSLSAADLERGASYTLFGIAAASGWYIAGDHSKGPLKTLALSAATLLGAREVVKPDDQRKILREGIRSISCALELDYQLEAAMAQLAPPPANQLVAINNLQQSIALQGFSHADVALTAGEPTATAFSKFQTQVYIAQYENLRSSVVSLLLALGNASPSRAYSLTSTVDKVLDTTVDQLEALTDPTAIGAATRERFLSTAGTVAQARKDADEYRKKLVPPTDASSSPAAALTRASSSPLLTIDGILAATAPLQKTFDDCMKPAGGTTGGGG